MNKVLFIIDDYPIYRLIASKTIKNLNDSINIIMCENGQIGLEKLKSIDDINKEIIVFLDINMPVLNGWEFLEHFEKEANLNTQNKKIYIISSSVDERDIKKANGFESVKSFIHKPLDSKIIHKIITEN